ncbi:MAG: hypothetical protein VB140_03885 [Burkholderia sp.]|nr:MAG: hypothetical protein E5299_01065 [Burkholderia gladioli]
MKQKYSGSSTNYVPLEAASTIRRPASVVEVAYHIGRVDHLHRGDRQLRWAIGSVGHR